MVLIVAVSVAAAAYYGGDGGKSSDEPAVDLADKTAVDLLPLERTLGLYEAPIATITFFDGDPDAAAEHLRRRVADIVYRNPWLGGWIAERDGAVKLFYDESSDDVAPGTFRRFEAGEVKLTRDTPYEDYGRALEGHGVVLGHNTELLGRNEPIWRASLVPDADRPGDRFALVTSMSHAGGDGHTFYRVYNMLRRDALVVTLNPRRKLLFSGAVVDQMGRREAHYIQHVSASPIWERFRRWEKKVDDKAVRLFLVDDAWVEEQKRFWNERAAEEEEDASEEEDENPARDDGAAGREGSPRPPAAPLPPLSANDVVTSWFWQTVGPTVGFMPVDFRGRLGGQGCNVSDLDAGNYQNPVPYMAGDYETPLLIWRSRRNFRRAGAENRRGGDDPTSLPRNLGQDSTFSVSVDQRSFQRLGPMDLGEGTLQSLHVHYFDRAYLDSVPDNMSFLITFSAGPNGDMGALIKVPESVMPKIEDSGIIKETIAAFGSRV